MKIEIKDKESQRALNLLEKAGFNFAILDNEKTDVLKND